MFNVHLNVHPPRGMTVEDRLPLIEISKNVIDDVVVSYCGSISAEHGIGRLKRPEFEEQASASHKALLASLRRSLDPQEIMNPEV